MAYYQIIYHLRQLYVLLLLFFFIYHYNENRINFARITLYQRLVRHISQKKKKNGKTLQRAFTHSRHFILFMGRIGGLNTPISSHVFDGNQNGIKKFICEILYIYIYRENPLNFLDTNSLKSK